MLKEIGLGELKDGILVVDLFCWFEIIYDKIV